MAIEIHHSTGDKEGRFFIEGTDEDLGYLEYRSEDGTLTVEHTVVGDELKGSGAARQLVDEFVKFANDNQYQIKSNCDYASHVMKKYYAIE